MKNFTLLKIFFIFLQIIAYQNITTAQIQVNTSNNATNLAQALAGSGVEISNAVLTCDQYGSGFFDSNGSNIGLPSGIVLTSGSVNLIPGPNNKDNAGLSIPGVFGDGDSQLEQELESLNNGNTVLHDACSLEFDFIPTGNQISFKYVFGSEEYLEYVGSEYNDAFALFLSGPGINGIKNIALIPNTNIPVSINTLNDQDYSEYYVDNDAGSTVQYDGFTVALTAFAIVEPCKTYHIKFVIADVADQKLDSGIFLEEGSLNSITGNLLPPTSSVGGNVNYAIEGCANGIIPVEIDVPPTSPLTLYYFIEGTAQMGVDFEPIADTLFFNIGETNKNITIIPIPDNIAEGTETVILKLKALCSNELVDSITLEIKDGLYANAGKDTTICSANLPVQLFTPPLSGVTYKWQPSTGLNNPNIHNPIATPNQTTTYTLSVSNDACTLTDTITISVGGGVPGAQVADSLLIVCPEGTATLQAQGGNTQQWSPANYLSCTNCPNPTFTPTPQLLGDTLTYEVTIADALCQTVLPVKIVVQKITVSAVGAPLTICENDTTTLIAGGNAQQYSWYNANNELVSSQNTVKITPQSSGAYTVVATSAQGCSSSKSVNITVNPLPTATINANQTTVCPNQNIQLTANGGTTYQWLNAQNQVIETQNPAEINGINQTSIFKVVATSAQGCNDTAQIQLNVFAPPTVTITAPDTVICKNESITFTANGASSYEWYSNGNVVSQNATLSLFPSISQTYQVVGTDQNGCTSQAQKSVVVNPLPVIALNAPDTVICKNETATVQASGGLIYAWTQNGAPVSNTATLSVSPPNTTTYTIAVFDSKGCKAQKNQTIVVNTPPILNITATDSVICKNENITLTAEGAEQYEWFLDNILINSQNSFNTTPPNTNFYVLNGTDLNGCTNTDSLLITVFDLPNATITANTDSLCKGGALSLSASGGTDYQWLVNGNVVGNTANLSLFPSISQNYTVVVSNANGCTNTSNLPITVFEVPNIAIQAPSAICKNDTLTLAAQGAESYLWKNENNEIIGNEAVIKIKITNTTPTATFTVTGTNANNCSKSATTTVTINPKPTFELPFTTQNICPNTVSLINLNPDYTYTWSASPNTAFIETLLPNGSKVALQPTENTTYFIHAVSNTGCSADTFLNINVYPIVNVNATPDSTFFCTNSTDSLQLSASGANEYIWLPPLFLPANNTGGTIKAFPNQNITYIVTGTDLNGCSDTALVKITLATPPPLSLPDSTQICAGGGTPLLLNVENPQNEPLTYNWLPAENISGINAQKPIVTPTNTIFYTVKVKNELTNCQSTDSIKVVVKGFENLVTSAQKNELCYGTNTTLTAQGGTSYQWFNAQNNVLMSENNTLTTDNLTQNPSVFYVKAKNETGCEAVDTLFIGVVIPQISYTANDTIVCKNDTVKLSASLATQYEWTLENALLGSNSTLNFVPTADTTLLTLTGITLTTQGEACTASQNINIVRNTVEIETQNFISLCKGDTVTITAQGTANFSWSPPQGLSNTLGAAVLAFPTNSTQYIVQGVGANNCPDTDTITVQVAEGLTVMVEKSTEGVCLGAPDSVVISLQGAEFYTWIQPTQGLSATEGSIVKAYPQQATTYNVIAYNGGGKCVDTLQIPVNIYSLPTATAQPTAVVCKGSTVQLQANGGVKYLWNNPLTLNNDTLANPIASPIANTQYIVTVFSEHGCKDTASIQVQVFEPLQSNTALPADVCLSQNWQPPVNIPNIENVQNLYWTTNGAGIINPTNTPQTTYTPATPDAGNTVLLFLNLENECNAIQDTFILNVSTTALAIDAGSDLVVCEGTPIALNANIQGTDILQIQWSGGQGIGFFENETQSQTQFLSTQIGETTLILNANSLHCSQQTDSLHLTILPKTQLQTNPDTTITEGSTLPVFTNVTGSGAYSWQVLSGDFNSLNCSLNCPQNFDIQPIETTLYLLQAETQNACAQNDSLLVTVLINPAIIIPNAFSPNGDGINETVKPLLKGADFVDFAVYNRWGERVHYTTNLAEGFTGYFNGNPLPVGTYAYYVQYRNFNTGNIEVKKGNITLIR